MMLAMTYLKQHKHSLAFVLAESMALKAFFLFFFKGSSLHRTIERLKKVKHFFNLPTALFRSPKAIH
jgi:hypothetical protein